MLAPATPPELSTHVPGIALTRSAVLSGGKALDFLRLDRRHREARFLPIDARAARCADHDDFFDILRSDAGHETECRRCSEERCVASDPCGKARMLSRQDDLLHDVSMLWKWGRNARMHGEHCNAPRLRFSARESALLKRHSRLLSCHRDVECKGIESAQQMRGRSSGSWSVVEGRYRVEPFGQRQQDETESNAAQLCSTVHLAQSPE